MSHPPRWLRVSIHLHSRYSDGSDDVPTILRTARDTGTDVVVLTDHDTRKARTDGYEGWHDGVLLIVGSEISPRTGDHFLALGGDHEPERRDAPAEELMQEATAAGADIYIAHPQGLAGRTAATQQEALPAWKAWESELYTGLEVWGYLHDILEDYRFWHLPRILRRAEDLVTGPQQRVLQRWDELNRGRRVVGLWSTDNHAKRIPLTPWAVLPHERVFRSFCARVQAPLTGNSKADIGAVLKALQEGRSFGAFEHLAPVETLVFAVSDPEGKQGQMGDAVPWREGLELEVTLPRAAQVRVLCDGELWLETDDAMLRRILERPGAYRMEARLHGRPWVFTNFIYVEPPKQA